MSTVVVTDNPAASRWEAHVDGVLAGFADYRRDGRVVHFVHTEVDPAFEGRGIAGRLARRSLDSVRVEGGRVVPSCPFYDSWIGKHPEYADLLAAS